ncbi:MAG: ATP-binding protein [Mariprofundales bacterium]|nr:ATP-binding protein [Mariprofundales bacterium]
MAISIKRLKQVYIELVDRYFCYGDEKHLHAIEKLGKVMMKSDLPLEKVAELHHDATKHLMQRCEMNPQQANALSLSLTRLLIVYGTDYRLRKEKKQTEHELGLASQALDSTSDGVLITDRHGIIIDVNRAFCRVTGYRREEVLGKNPSMLQSGRQDGEFYRRMWQQLREAGRWQGKVWNRRKNGEIYLERLTINAMSSVKGNVRNYVGVFSDISDQIALESQLRQSQKMEALGTLVGGIAHDFNNMLGGMLGNIYLAKRSKHLRGDLLKRLETIEELGQRSAGVVAQLLTFARKSNVDMQPLRVTPLVKETCKLARVGIPESIGLEFRGSSDDLMVCADLTQIQQLLLNLINNARDAVADAPNPMIRVEISQMTANPEFLARYAEARQGDYCHLQVEDNGHGIAAAHLEKVFEPFFTTKVVGKGTGLGLAMVYGAVRTHHGMIEVTSQVGQGTCFHLYFPLHRQAVRDRVDPVPPQPVAFNGQGETLLLVDDEPSVRHVMEELLIAMGYRVVSAASGEEALVLYAQHRAKIRLVITDVVMPGMGGGKLGEKLLAQDGDLPLIFVSGYNLEQLGNQSKIPAGYPLLTKPVHIDVLTSTIRQQLMHCPAKLKIVA